MNTMDKLRNLTFSD